MDSVAERTAPATTGSPPPRKRHRLRKALLAVLGIVFAAWLILFVTKGRFLRHPFERLAGSLLHRTVSVGGDFQLYFAPLRLKFVAEKFTVSNPAWATRPYLFQADRIDTRIAPLSLLFGRRRMYWLDLTNGAADLEWNAAHDHNTWTFSDAKGGKPFVFPTIDRAQVAGSTVRYLDGRLKILADLKIDTIQSTNARIGGAVHLTGRGLLRATPFTLTAALLSPDATVSRGHNQLRLEAHLAHNILDIAGDLPSIAEIENVPLSVEARGRNLNELLHVIGVAIPETRRYRLTGQLVQSGDDYRFTHVKGTFGDSDIAGTFTIHNVEPRVKIDASLATRSLDIVDAAPFIGYNPDVVAAQGVIAAAAQTGAAPARLLPDAELPIEAMKAFDAHVHYTVGVVRSKKVPVSNVDATVALNNSELQLSPFTFSMSRGNVAADIMLDAQQRPTRAFYDIRLAPTPMGRLLAGFGVAEAGTTGTIKGRVQLQGVGDTLHDSLATANGRIAFTMPQGTFWTRNVQLAELDVGTFVQKMFQDKLKQPVAINCGLIAFTVRHGTAAADPILIDTSKNVIGGRGAFSFATEKLDLAFRADGKKFSLFSGQSPIGLGGYFAKPSIDVVSPELLSRAGTALGLGLLATPPAAILAFVDVGNAKAAACGPVLAAASASAQRTVQGKPLKEAGNGSTSKAMPRKKFLGIF